jgi:UDP:flavonoid glycosyltransferase YjiC (YdhE family)
LAHIVLITNRIPSVVNSNLEMSRRLREAGHRVTIVAPGDVRDRIAREGETFVGLEQDGRMARRVEADPRPAMTRPLAALRWLGRRRGLRRESIAGDEIGTVVRDLAPDLLLIDVEMHAAVIATARLGVPTLLTTVFFSVFRRPGLPPLHLPIAPGDTAGRRLLIGAAWAWTRLGAIARRGRNALRAAVRDPFRPVPCDTVEPGELRRLARLHGYDLRAETDRAQWLRPHTYRRLPLLSYTAREMELPHDPPPLMHYVGPMVKLERAEPALAPEAARRWDEMKRARGNGAAARRPLVYCSLGSFWTGDRALLRRVLDVFARRDDWDLVLGLGGTLAAADLDPVPANALVLEWAPQLEVLAHADAAIVHGGVNSICECARLGVPMLVCSARHIDQNGNAVRVAHHRLGVVAGRDAGDAGAIERGLERVLADGEIRASVDAMRKRLRAYESPPRAVEVVERILAEARP